MKKNLLVWTLLFSLTTAGFTACSDDDAEASGKTVFCTAEFDSTTIPQTIPAEGHLYRMFFTIAPQGGRGEKSVFVPWQFRITLGDAVGNAVKVPDARTEVMVKIPINYSTEQRSVVIEMASADDATPPQWQTIVEAVQEPSLTVYRLTEFDSTTIPQTVGCNGGTYEVRFKSTLETRAADPVFVEWQYRITIGSQVGQTIKVTEPLDQIEVVIPANYTEQQQGIAVEMADAGEEPFWRKIVTAQQAEALMKVGDFYWTKGNVTLLDGRFALADKMSDTGLFFRNGSIYGVPSDRDTYAGTAYTPEPVQIALGDIPYGLPDADPCSMIDAALRTPTYAELFDLGDYFDRVGERNGISGVIFNGGTYFLPMCGSLDVTTGQIAGSGINGGYWGLGADYEGAGLIYILNDTYPILYYDLMGTGMATLRCVKNIARPAYVSHTPTSVSDNGQFDLTVTTTPGAFSHYEVSLEADDGSLTRATATREQPEVRLIVPKNDEPVEREWRIFVNSIYTGASFVQPALKDYARYASHTPLKASYEAFTLSVTCESDLASFPVTVKSSEGEEWTQTGSKDQLTVRFPIAANPGAERTFSIWVNGADTKQTVVQEMNPASNSFSVIWSEGYVTIRDGEYVFADPKVRGMYFKWGSKYGIQFEGEVTGSTKYQGTVYGPAEQTIENYPDIPYNEVDPCSLVAPAGTWRMPTAAEYEELIADGPKEQQTGVYKMWSDGMQKVYFAASGQISATTYKILIAANIGAWSSTPGTTAGRYSYLMFSTNTSTGKVNAGGAVPETAMMVRCVRER